MQNFKLYSNYYDLFYAQKDYRQESTLIDKLIQDHSIITPSDTILDLGSGTGSHAAIFSELGYNITGIERSSGMVEIANKKKIKNYKCITGDIENFSIPKKYPIVTALFHVFSYLNSDHQIRTSLRNIDKHMMPNGLFIFDVWFTPAVYSQQPQIRINKKRGLGVDITRIADPDVDYWRNVVDVNYDIIVKDLDGNYLEDFTEKHSMKHYSVCELQNYAADTNFTLLSATELLTGDKPSSKTWAICIVLQKNG